MKKNSPRLTLNRETLASLAISDLENVVGGSIPGRTDDTICAGESVCVCLTDFCTQIGC